MQDGTKKVREIALRGMVKWMHARKKCMYRYARVYVAFICNLVVGVLLLPGTTTSCFFSVQYITSTCGCHRVSGVHPPGLTIMTVPTSSCEPLVGVPLWIHYSRFNVSILPNNW